MPRKLHAHQIDIKYTILNLLIFQTRKNRTIRWTIVPNRYKIYYFKPIDFSKSQKQNNKMDYSAK